MSSNYKGNKLNTFSDEKNKIKQAEIYLRGPTQTREGQVLSSRFGFGGLCSREDTIIITQTWQQRRRRKKEGGDVEMETRGGGDELGRSGSLHRRGLCMQYVYADDGDRLGESADRPAAGRDIFSPFATDCQFVRTSSHSRIPAEIFFWITSNFCLVSSSPRPVHSPAHQYLELSSTLPSNYRTQIGACRAVSNSFLLPPVSASNSPLNSSMEISENAPTTDRILGCLRAFTTRFTISTIP
jgi:hypothetical protein